ncbi:MAG: glycosyltransferase family 4 protein [Verrucomicrobia bacterium]|nr:glycosyltransferase family 4 protein [Verrucomicrobiota bacterium]MCH8526824.1 hypothetical protein [Kiritimatiellia bacterium]
MIALIHHHLRRGGVTRVMFSHARILRDAGETVVIYSGEPSPEPLPQGVELRILPELAYSQTADTEAVETLVQHFRSVGDETLLHIHNHSLGKSPAVTAAVAELARGGTRMVLQIHDFAEDGRPTNLNSLLRALPDPGHTLYPHSPRIHYAVLQARDHKILLDAGLPPERVSILPNVIEFEADLTPPASPPRNVLYLSRCIRRKNIGEFLLWAKTCGKEMDFATSLIPENPAERPVFDRWAALAHDLKLSVRFGVGMNPNTSFNQVVSSADACITTSVGEGFGMSFLEPYLMDRPLFGRDLPDITAGFKTDGIRLDGLYETLPVPLDALDPDFWPRALRTVNSYRATLGCHEPLAPAALCAAWVADEQIDFGRLDETAQAHVLRGGYAPDLPRNTDPGLRRHNRAILQTRYNPATTLTRLRELYARTRTDPAPPAWLPPARIRDAFSDPARIRLLRT